MSKKNRPATTATEDLPALRIGSRVRCSDDGVEGRIVWANAVSVKIRWDDGEQVTWRRDSLAGRPIEIIDAVTADDEIVPLEPAATTQQAEEAATEQATPPEQGPVTPAPDAEAAPTTAEQSDAVPAADGPVAEMAPQAPAMPKRQRKAPAEPKGKKLSAIDAAARVLAEAGVPMNCQEMIAAMAAKGYWSSPNGKTPHATLYSAILREIATKGEQARFTKTERGKFARSPAA